MILTKPISPKGRANENSEPMKTLSQNYLSLAAFNYRLAVKHARAGNAEKADTCLTNARAFDTFAKESDK